MEITNLKNSITKLLSVILIAILVVTGVSFGPFGGGVKAQAASGRRVGDHRIVKPPKRCELLDLEDEEGEELVRRAYVRRFSKIGEYGQLLTDHEKKFYELMVGAVSNYAPYGTDGAQALEKYGYMLEVPEATYDYYVGLDDSEYEIFIQHIIEATAYDNIEKVQFMLCDYTDFQAYGYDNRFFVKVAAISAYPNDFATMNSQLKNAKTRFLNSISIPSGATDQEIETRIHDALIDNVRYFEDYRHVSSFHTCFTAYGALVLGEAVCDGYSQALAILLEAKNIDSIVVTGAIGGDVDAGHAWNRVQIGSEWYEVDATWDDEYLEDDGSENYEERLQDLRHDFFNVTTDFVETPEYGNHLTVAPFIGELMAEPRARGTTYTYPKLKAAHPEWFVSTPVTAISTSIDSATLKRGETTTVKATVSPAKATNKFVRWFSSDPLVAGVDNGVITGISSGTATITAESGSDSSIKKEISVTVYSPVTGLTLDNTKLTMNVGETAVITATVTPANADDTSVSWTSSNEAVATVENGTVTGVKNGTVTITAVSNYDASIAATCEVTVKNPVKGLTLDKNDLAMNVGETAILTATITPPDADNTNIKWTSSNEAVATVVNGTVTAVASGTATITAVSESDTSRAAACNVRVSKTAGEEFTTGAGNNTGFYKVIEAQEKTVSFNGDENKNAKTLKVPETIKDENGIAYTVTEIGKGAYKGRKKLKKVVIPKTVKAIRKNAFKGCGKLSKITIYADSLTTIEKGAFSGISKDATITIKASSKSKYNKLIKKIKKAGAKNAKFKRKK